MITCPVKGTKAWKDLVKAVGETMAFTIWNEYEGNVPQEYYSQDILYTESYKTSSPKELTFSTQSNKISDFAKLNNIYNAETPLEKRGDKVYNFVFDLSDKLGIQLNESLTSPEEVKELGVSPSTVVAFYSKLKNKVYLTDNFTKLGTLDQTRILSHESLHGIIFNRINQMSEIQKNNFESRINDFISKMKENEELRNYSSVQRVLEIINRSGYEELITYAMTDREFAAALNSIVIGERPEDYYKRTFWEKLKELILSVISDAYTMFDELSDILDAHLDIDNKNNPGIYELGFTKEIENLDSNFIKNDYARKLAELNKSEAQTLHQKLVEADGEGLMKRTNKLLTDVEDKLKSFLTSIGIKYEAVAKIYDANGEEINAVAKADIVNKVVQVIENKRDFSTLPEETSHVFVALLKGSPLYNEMMTKITRFNTYNEVKEQYKRLYNGDETKIREEAIGKLISIHILNQEVNENDLNKNLFSKWWEKIWNAIKLLFSRLKSKDMSPFIESAKQILQGRIDGLQDLDKVISMNQSDVQGLLYYEMSQEDMNERDTLIQKIKDTVDNNNLSYDIDTRTFNINGRKIKHRVYDYEYKYYLSQGYDKESLEPDEIYAAKSTYIHKINGAIMKSLINKVPINKSALITEVAEDLLMRSDTIRKIYQSSINDKRFFEISDKQFNELVKGIEFIYNQIQENSNRIKKYTEGAKGEPEIFTEVNAYLEKEDLSGMVDVMVVYPNGAVGTYFYENKKFYKDFETGTVSKLSKATQEALDIRMLQTKRILANEFGIKEFAESRVFPINLQLNRISKSKKGLDASIGFANIEMGANNDKEYLQQIPVKNELVTEDKPLSEALEKMINYRKKLEIERKERPESIDLKFQYNKIDEAIKKIQLERKVIHVYNEVAFIDRQLRKLELEPSNSPNYNYADFNNFITFARVFREFSGKLLETEGGSTLTPENKLKMVSISAMTQNIESIALNKIIDSVFTGKSKESVLKIQETGNLGSIFKQLRDYDAQTFKRMAKLVELSLDNVRRQFNEIHSKMEEVDSELRKWAKANGMSIYDAFKMIYNVDKRGLISRYNKEYYTLLNKARKTKNLAWMLNNTELTPEKEASLKIAIEKYKSHLERMYPDEFDGDGKLSEDGINNQKLREKLFKEYRLKFDIISEDTRNAALLYHKNPYITLKDNSEYYSDGWKTLVESKNKPLLNYYNQYVEFNKLFNNLVEKNIKSTFVAELRQDTIDKIIQLGPGAAGNLWRELLHSLETREYDISNRAIDPTTGALMPTIPLLYTDLLREQLSNKEVEEIEKDLKAQGLEPGSLEYETQREKNISSLELKKGSQFKSFDLTKSLLVFANSALMNKHFNNSLDEIKALQNLMHSNKIKTTKLDIFGKPIINKITGKSLEIEGASLTDIDTFDKFINHYWYGLETETKDFVVKGSKIKDENGNVISEGKTYSGQKLYRLFSKLTTLKALGLNIPAAISNTIGLYSNYKIVASEGLLFNDKQSSISEANRIKKDKLTMAFIDFIEPYTKNLRMEKANDLTGSKANKWLTTERLMSIWKYPDDTMDEIITGAMIQNFGFDENGRIKSLKLLPKDTKSLYELAKIEDNKLVVPGFTDNQENFLLFKRLIRKASEKIKGVPSEENINLVGKNLFMKIIMKFRNWIPGLAKARFQGIKFDEDTTDFDVGRYRVFMGEFLRTRSVSDALNNFKNLLTQTIVSLPLLNKFKGNFNIYDKGISDVATDIYFNEFLESHPELRDKISKEEFKVLRASKMAGFAREMALVLTMFAIFSIIKAMIPDDDEEYIARFLAKDAFKASSRGLAELSFWISPSSVNQLISSPIADWGTITDVGKWVNNTLDVTRDITAESLDIGDKNYHAIFDKAPKDKTPMFYRTVGLIPFISSISDFLDFFDQDVKQRGQ